MISQTAGSNAHEINQKIDQLAKELKSSLPNDLVISNLMDTNDFLNASISEVVKTLLETILLVILVVYIFLQSGRSTIIPTVSIIVSLIGTFAFMYLVGFSLNLLTLFALVLVIGTVVDDAIVVVEAVQSKFDEGYRSPIHGCHEGDGWHLDRHCHHIVGLYGCVHPYIIHGRHQWNILSTVRSYHGCGCRHLGYQCPNALSRSLFPTDDTSPNC
jgi:preprotein translocase subunit SecF